MKLLIIAAASLAVVSCASLSLEDLEFHAWKLKFGEEAHNICIIYSCNQYIIEVFIDHLLNKIHQNIFPSAKTFPDITAVMFLSPCLSYREII